jgi:REP element-mobilizing transposase RayT
MARLPRYFVKGQAQHVIQRGNNREPIFASKGD